MGITAAVVISTVATAIFAFAVLALVLLQWRQHRWQTRWKTELPSFRSAVRKPIVWISILLVTSLFIPWLTGSVVGVHIPGSLFSLPWVRWWILLTALPTIAFAGATICSPHFHLRIALLFAYALVVGEGCAFLLLAAIAQRVTEVGVIADTLLRGFHSATRIIPVVRVGPGELLYLWSGVLGAVSLVIGPREKSPKEMPPSTYNVATAESFLNIPGRS